MNIALAETRLSYSPDKVESINNIELQWLKENSSGFSLFRLRSGINQHKITGINNILENLHKEFALFFLGCEDVISNSTRSGVEELRATINYLSNNLLSFTISTSSFCKGMKTINVETRHYFYDLNSLKQLKLDDILNIEYSPKLEAEAYKKLDDKNILSPKGIRHLVFIQEGWPEVAHTDTESCDYYNHFSWPGEWNYTNKGIIFYPSFSTMERIVCMRPFLIPFDQLDRFKHLSFPYALQSY